MSEISGFGSQFLEFFAGLGVSSLTGGVGTKLSSSIASLLNRRIGVLPSIALQALLGGLSAAEGQNISGRILNLNQSEQDSSRAIAVFLTGALTAAANAVVKNKNLSPTLAEGRFLLRAAEVLTGSRRANNWAGYLQEAGINFGMAFGEDAIGSGLGDGFSWQRSLFTGLQAAGVGHVVSRVTRSGSHFQPPVGSRAGRDGLVIDRENGPLLVSKGGQWSRMEPIYKGEIHNLTRPNGDEVAYADLDGNGLSLIASHRVTDETPPFVIQGREVVLQERRSSRATHGVFVVIDGKIHQVDKPPSDQDDNLEMLSSLRAVVGKNGTIKRIRLNDQDDVWLETPRDGVVWMGYTQPPLFGDGYIINTRKCHYVENGKVYVISGKDGDRLKIGDYYYRIVVVDNIAGKPPIIDLRLITS